MSKSKEIRLLNDRLDYYTMEAEDDQFDAEEVIRLLKRLDELEPLPEPDMSAEESLEAFWEYVKEREREEKICMYAYFFQKKVRAFSSVGRATDS